MVRTFHLRAVFWVLLGLVPIGLQGQSTNFLTVGIGQQAAWFQTDALQSSGLTVIQNNDLAIRATTLFFGYEKINKNRIFHRGCIGISSVDQKNVFDAVNAHSVISSTYSVSILRLYGCFGIGPLLESGRVQFIFGPQLTVGYGFPAKYSQDYKFFRIADSTTTRTISETRNPAGISPSLEVFLSIRYQLAKRLYVGLEPRIGGYLTFVNGNIETTRTTFDGAGNTIGETEELTEFKRANFQSSFYLSPPILTLSYHL